MNNTNWNEICFLLSENIKSDINENLFEQSVIRALEVLGWKQFLGDFDIRPSYQIGAANRVTPDFVIKSSENHKLFVIEIKQPNIPLTSTFQKQLFSYMRQLKLDYGILIGQGIQIFYDGKLANQEDPVLLETIRFEKNNEKGEKFVQLFSKGNFNIDQLNEFTINILEKLNRDEEFKKLKSKILSDKYKDKLVELIKQDLLNEYDGELIDSVLSEVILKILKKENTTSNTNLPSKQFLQPKQFIPSADAKSKKQQDYTQYFFNGHTLGKGRLVLEVIKDYIAKHPETTLNELKTLFPDSLQGQETFTTENEAKHKRDRRNFFKPGELIKLADETIAVSTEWGIHNISRFIDRCTQLNINIEVAS